MLSKTDLEWLAQLEPRLQEIRDHVTLVADGLATCLYLYGPGGTSKSWTTLEQLKKLRKAYRLFNTKVTAKGLFNVLSENTKGIIVVEDAESMFTDKDVPGILRSATWSQSRKRHPERKVTWTRDNAPDPFTFRGGLILVANRPLPKTPEYDALQTRITTLEYKASDEEIAALMRSVADEGYSLGAEDYLSPEECHNIVERIIIRSGELEKPLDMRIMLKTFNFFIGWKSERVATHWMDLLDGLLSKRVGSGSGYMSREERIESEALVAEEIWAMDLPRKEKVRLWQERVPGASEMRLYRRLRRE